MSPNNVRAFFVWVRFCSLSSLCIQRVYQTFLRLSSVLCQFPLSYKKYAKCYENCVFVIPHMPANPHGSYIVTCYVFLANWVRLSGIVVQTVWASASCTTIYFLVLLLKKYNYVTFITYLFFPLQIMGLQTLCTDCPHFQNRNFRNIVVQTRRNDTVYVILEFLVIL